MLVHEKTELEFSLLPPGSFLMGSPESEARRFEDEGPRHLVTFTRAFLLCRTECTRSAWTRGADATPTMRAWAKALPVVDVSWADVRAWCDGSDLRLPSEAEWEHACRAGTTTAYWAGDWEDDLARVGWYWANSGDRVREVGEKPANPFGLFDVHGNLWEWCEDTWHDDYTAAPPEGFARLGPASADRVIRGGSGSSSTRDARSASRYGIAPEVRNGYAGFRPAATVGGR